MPKEYLLAPNFDLPPPPDGPLKLGQILDDPKDPRYPLNPDDVVSPLESKLYNQTAIGVTAVRSQLGNKEFKLWARMADLIPVGADAEISRNRSSTDIFTIKNIETSYFLPSRKYLEASIKAAEDVKRYLEGGLWGNDVYMITGLKVARDGSVTSFASDGKKTSGQGSVDLTQVAVPISAGAKAGSEVASSEATHVASLEPFVLAYQVRKILYKPGKPPKTEAYNRGAMFGKDPAGEPDLDEKIIVEGLEEEDTVPESLKSDDNWVLMPALDGELEEQERVWLRSD
jgi:hypothetical protein